MNPPSAETEPRVVQSKLDAKSQTMPVHARQDQLSQTDPDRAESTMAGVFPVPSRLRFHRNFIAAPAVVIVRAIKRGLV